MDLVKKFDIICYGLSKTKFGCVCVCVTLYKLNSPYTQFSLSKEKIKLKPAFRIAIQS